jgi:hypothetical protein
MKGRAGAHSVALSLLLASVAVPARAATTVALLPPEPADAVTDEAYRRVHAELTTLGYGVVHVDCVPTLGAMCASAGGRRADADAFVLLLRGREAYLTEVRARGARPGTVLVRRSELPLDAADAATVAMDAVELVRALLLNGDLEPAPRTRAQPHRVPVAPAPAKTDSAQPWYRAVSTGIAALHSRGVGTGLGAALAFTFGLDTVRVRAQLVGNVLAVEHVGREGTAESRQYLSLLQGALAVFRTKALRFDAELASGAAFVTAQGTHADNGYNQRSSTWALAYGGGVRCQWVTGPAQPFVATHLIGFAPRPAVVIGSQTVGTLGAPLIVPSLGLDFAW